MQVDLDLYEGGQPLTPPDAEDAGNNSRHLRESTVQRQREVEITPETGAVSTRGRQLQSTTQVTLDFSRRSKKIWGGGIIPGERRGRASSAMLILRA